MKRNRYVVIERKIIMKIKCYKKMNCNGVSDFKNIIFSCAT